MRRRGKGEGGLTKRSDGRWQGSFVGSDGKRHYVYGASRREANEKLTAALRDKALGVYVAGPSQTVEQFMVAWLASKHDVKAITAKRYDGILRHQVIPHLGSVPIRKVTPQHIASLYATLRASHSPATVNQVHAVLHNAFDQALRWDLIARNPVTAVTPPRIPRNEMRVLSVPDMHRLIEAADGDEFETLYVLALSTGARQGELLALRWQDVDLEAGTLDINATLVRLNGTWHRSEPKTPASRRVIPLTEIALRSLRAHRVRMAERLLRVRGRTEGETLVFLTPQLEAVNGFHVTERHLKPLLRRAGLPQVRFHDLRHAFASMMISNGVRIDLVSRMLGHSSPSTTLNVYAHLMPGDMESAVRLVDEVLAG